MGLFSAFRSIFGKSPSAQAQALARQAATQATGVPVAGHAAAAAVGQHNAYAQPGQVQPGYAQPGQVQPGQVQPGHVQPAHAQPGQVQAGYAQPGHVQPAQAQPGQPPAAYAQPGQPQQGYAQPAGDDDDDDDDFVRDYALEAVDDFQTFDLGNDISRWFLADHQIEMAWEDKAERMAKLREFGVRDEPHYYQLRATVERYIQSPHAQQRWGDIGTIMQLKMNATMDMHRQQMQQRAEGELAGELQPVEGVSMEAWAQAQAKVASGGQLPAILAELGIDQPAWDRVSAEWNARMSRDTTCTIATAYGQAFTGAGQGQFGAAGASAAAAMGPGGSVAGTEADAPIPLERYVEIMVAQDIGGQRGEDAQAVLARFGMSPMDWGTVGGWWSQYMSRTMMANDSALLNRYNQIEAHYRAQYGSPAADNDVNF